MSWWPSFTFSLPTFSLPPTIQRRFFSFILKRSLGHLLKPGQLDVDQIDAQIGNGFVEVKDLELDSLAISTLLKGLPLELQTGSIGRVTVRIPWPNPFTSTIGLSLSGLHLTLVLTSPPQADHLARDLAESVASVAETFMHDELSQGEEALLRESVYPSNVPPGSLDPFLLDDEPSPSGNASDPEGISIFAGLFERLLARFEFDATDLRITVINPGQTAFTLHVRHIQYFTGSQEPSAMTEKRTVQVSEVKVTMQDISPRAPSRQTTISTSATPMQGSLSSIHSPSDNSDSELDDETQMMMSQSLVGLPPRGTLHAPPISPALSTISSASESSSMYQSAISDSAVHSPVVEDEPCRVESQLQMPEDIILSILDTVTLSLTTPPPYAPPADVPDSSEDEPKPSRTPLRLDVNLETVVLAIRAQNIRAIVSCAALFSSPQSPEPLKENSAEKTKSLLDRLDCSLRIRNIVGLALSANDGLDDFFTRPLAPPSLKHCYWRLHVDTIHAQLASSSLLQLEYSTSDVHDFTPAPTASCTISDFSLLAFYGSQTSASSSNSTLHSSPIIITDLHLASSYHSANPTQHTHPRSEDEKRSPLPSMKIVDWTSEPGTSHGASLKAWRTRPQVQINKRHSSGQSPRGTFVSNVGLSASPNSPRLGALGLPSSPPSPRYTSIAPPAPSSKPDSSSPAVTVTFSRRSSEFERDAIQIDVVPLHVFVQLGQVGSILSFVDDAIPDCASESEASRQHTLDSSFLQNDNLNEFPTSAPTEPHNPSTPPSVSIRFCLSLLRIEIRAPPAATHHVRSGCFVLDLHGIGVLTSGLPERRRGALRFQQDANSEDDWYSDLERKELMSVQVLRIVAAYAPPGDNHAAAFLSVGPASAGGGATDHLQNIVVAYSPKNTQSERAQTLGSPSTLLVRLPSAHVALTKEILDGLQLWADDLTQWGAKLGSSQSSRSVSTSNSVKASRNPSLIGSRYFAKRTGSGSTESDMAGNSDLANDKSEFVVKVLLNEAFVRLTMATVKNEGLSRKIDVSASYVDGLIEIKPDGKDAIIGTVGVSGINLGESLANASHTIIHSRVPEEKNARHPALKLRFHSYTVPGTTAKESRVKLGLFGLNVEFWCDTEYITDLLAFVKAPPGAFETVVPSERTALSVSISESSARLTASTHPGAFVLSLCDVGFSTELVGDSPESIFNIFGAEMSIFLIDDCASLGKAKEGAYIISDAEYWASLKYALLTSINDFKVEVKQDNSKDPVDVRTTVDGLNLTAHLCADTISGIASFVTGVQSAFVKDQVDDYPLAAETVEPLFERKLSESTSSASQSQSGSTNLLRSLDEDAFRKVPEIGPVPDMVEDDLPSNPEYLDASFGAAAGFRPLDDEDLNDDFDSEEVLSESYKPMTGVSRFGGETIRMLEPVITIVENFYENLPPGALVTTPDYGDTSVRVRLHGVNCRLLLYDGYDWNKTRTAIQEEVKRVKRRLAKIRQLLANGQSYDPTVDEVNTLLFNSVYVGLDQEAEELEPGALIEKIDEELLDDQTDIASESSWQSFKTKMPSKPQPQGFVARSKKLTRSRGPNIEFSLKTFEAEFDQYRVKNPLVSRMFFTVRDLEILDHMKSSTWSTFLTQMRSDSRGNIREAESNMVRVELQTLLPNTSHANEEARLKAKLLPLRLHVDQDALDFLKKFFSFSDPNSAPPAPPPSSAPKGEIYFQHAEVFPVDIKLDYKPRRVDYRALKEGKSIELMNFFHFDGAEMTLRHITLKGITGWPRFFDSLNDLWTPDVKANQLVDVISGVSPIRSVVNVGSGVADLILLPIAQYKKDGRVIRGLQKGTTAFVKSTAMEAIKIGAQLANGTQVVLEQAENFLGGQGSVTAEALQGMPSPLQTADILSEDDDDSEVDLISRYAEQPRNVKEGVQLASKAFAKNLKYAGQTILAVPMEVYEKSSKEGPARSVIRAVPIAVLKPMIGASEAVSKTLLGLRNTLDPSIPIESDVKYKHR